MSQSTRLALTAMGQHADSIGESLSQGCDPNLRGVIAKFTMSKLDEKEHHALHENITKSVGGLGVAGKKLLCINMRNAGYNEQHNVNESIFRAATQAATAGGWSVTMIGGPDHQ